MLIKDIDKFRCDGCGSCERTCPGDVIRLKDGKAIAAYPEDCTGCVFCEMACPRYAIKIE